MRAISVIITLTAISLAGLGSVSNVAAAPTCPELCSNQQKACLKQQSTSKAGQAQCKATAKSCNGQCK